ncbi:helix-turn-helix transcriptional regulator [Pseudofrankia asymbiotica]|uniref:helix-turn-helix transcriptional regulator n=1 Tax=Pseudofrankia asymbiotica TaxID=1834516 RepID=UPI00308329E2
MLRLLSLLQTHRYWAGVELADRLQVSARTLRRDVDRLRELGYPVLASRGVAGGYQLRAGAAVPPLLLDDDEAVAIVVGLRAAVAGPVAGIEEAAVRALAKVAQVIPRRLRHRADALGAYTVPVPVGGPPVDAGMLTAIALAARAEERLRFGYIDREGAATHRHVEPHRMVSLSGRWYLVGFDVDRSDWRTFRLDRIAEPLVSGARFRPRPLPGGDAAAFVRAAVRSAPARQQAEVLVWAPVDEVARVAGRWAVVEPWDPARRAAATEPAGTSGRGRLERDAVAGRGSGDQEAGGERHDAGPCRLRMGADDPAWAMLLLARIGAPFEVLGPPELAEHVRAAGRLFTSEPPPR